MNIATKTITDEIQKPALTLVEKPLVKSGAESRAEIKAMLDSKRRNPAHLFDNKLTAKQREALCFIAGLKRQDLAKTFNELNAEARVSIKKAIMLCGSVFSTFNDANALATEKFVGSES